MITQNEEKKMLIESMKKLTSHVSGNIQRQRQIFEALSLQDFNKIINNLKDQNEYLRRISALLLCQLFYRNDQTKAGLVSLLGIQPKWGRICLGGIPETIFKYPSTLKKCVQLMNGQAQQDEEDKICWLINLERKTLKIQFLDYKKYSSFTFMDPVKNIFGLTIRNPSAKRQQKLDRLVENNYKTKGQGESSSRRAAEQQKNNSNTEYYKQYIQQRQKRESIGYGKKALNLTLDLHDSKRASIGGSSPQYRNQLSNSINLKKDLNVSLQIKPVNTDSKYKMENNRSTKPIYQVSPKVSLGNSQQNWNNHYNHNSTYQHQIATERLNSSRFGNGTKANPTRQSVSESHERFYKRVKDLFKK